MCKVMIITKIKNETHPKVVELMKSIAPLMSIGNKDGIGYATLYSDGNVYGERWLKNEQFFQRPLESMYDFLESTKMDRNEFGVKGEVPVALTFHTRYSTNTINMKNTHPFYVEDTSLIHNGVIRNPEVFGMKQSTCDSESILNGYIENNVKDVPKNITKVTDRLLGYWAVGILGKNEAGPYVDIFKHNASLHMCYIPELDIDVFITEPMDLKKVCWSLGYNVIECGGFKNNWFVRINANTGEVIESFDCNIKVDKPVRPKVTKQFTDYLMMDETIEDITHEWSK